MAKGKKCDITNQKFGRLIAKQPTGTKLKNGAVVWECECDCGNIVNVPIGNLNTGHTQSCGCLNLDSTIIKKRTESRKKYNVNGTCTHQLKRHNKNKNNTSGITGVTMDRRTGKWKAQIIFKRKLYYLGTYEKIEDATNARTIAEKKLFGDFLEWYKNEWGKDYEKC